MDIISNYSSIGLGSAITTAILSGGIAVDSYAQSVTQMKHMEEMAQSSQDYGISFDRYILLDASTRLSESDQIETLHFFASNILENIKPLPSEFSQLIDENFWDLV